MKAYKVIMNGTISIVEKVKFEHYKKQHPDGYDSAHIVNVRAHYFVSIENFTYKRSVFTQANKDRLPMSYYPLSCAVIGPFRTRRGAELCCNRGFGMPPLSPSEFDKRAHNANYDWRSDRFRPIK